MQLFDRRVRVTIRRASGQTVRISSLRVAFGARKSLRSTANTMQLDIYNLNDATRARVLERDDEILLEAGYGDQTEVVFTGDVTRVQDQPLNFKSLDRITKIHCADGGIALRDREISHSFSPGTSVEDVFRCLSQELGLAEGEIRGVEGREYVNGLSISGPVRRELDRLADELNLDWSIQDNVLEVLPSDGASDEETVALEPSTGLIGTPSRTERGVRLRALLTPSLRPGRRVQVRSERLSGTYKIATVAHRGDTHANRWYSEIEAVEFGDDARSEGPSSGSAAA